MMRGHLKEALLLKPFVLLRKRRQRWRGGLYLDHGITMPLELRCALDISLVLMSRTALMRDRCNHSGLSSHR
eukprot:9473988-Pyramimonas_sp.AAC.1